MINCNRVVRESMERSKKSQKNIHTASINLRAQDSYSEAIYLPLREVVQKKVDKQHQQLRKNL